jgi:S1-C subfamily serine protease
MKMNPDFIKEEKKKKPLNTGKLFKKFGINIAMAVVFGVIASLVILVMEPFLKKITTNTESQSANLVKFPEEEMTPEEMLSEYMMQESAISELEEEETIEAGDLPFSDEQVNILLSRIKFDAAKYRQMTISMSNYTRELGNYMVTVTSVESSVDWLDSVDDKSKTTSGIIIAENGVELLILADASAITNPENLTLTLRNGVKMQGYVKNTDSVTGLAIIATDLKNFPEEEDVKSYIAPMGSSTSIYVGLSVVAVGSPQGVSGSIGYGIVDTPKEMISDVDTYYYRFKTNILGSKNASGALFNMQGQVIGIITSKETSSADNTVIIAYGITELKDVIEKLSNSQQIGYLGITGTNVTAGANSELGVPMGAFVTGTEMDSPAMLAGLQLGDVIVGINERAIETYAEYVNQLQKFKPDEEITLQVRRKSQNEYAVIEIPLTVTARQ